MASKSWVLPISVDVDKQVEQAMKRADVREAYLKYEGDPQNFKDGLRAYIEQVNGKNNRMRACAAVLDTTNKTTVPLDATLDAFSILGGVGTGVKAIKTVILSPAYLAYALYYGIKTGDVLGAIKNLGYEGLSWLSLGSLPHLINYYTLQADKYSAEEGSERFLKNLENRGLEKTVLNFEAEKRKIGQGKKKKQKQDLEKIAA